MSKKKEQESEDHMLKLAEREDGQLKQEIGRIQKELNDLKERENVYEVISLTKVLYHTFWPVCNVASHHIMAVVNNNELLHAFVYQAMKLRTPVASVF